jgi:hypothetical protein
MLPELKKGLKKNIKPILREYSSESPVITKAQLKKLLIDKSIIDNKNNFLD